MTSLADGPTTWIENPGPAPLVERLEIESSLHRGEVLSFVHNDVLISTRALTTDFGVIE